MSTMKKLFTATGQAHSTEMTAVGWKEVPFNFSHVVSAETREEAEDKVLEYYVNHEEGDFQVDSIAIHDFID